MLLVVTNFFLSLGLFYNLEEIILAMVGIWKIQTLIRKKIEVLSVDAGTSPEQVKKSACIDSGRPQQVSRRCDCRGVCPLLVEEHSTAALCSDTKGIQHHHRFLLRIAGHHRRNT